METISVSQFVGILNETLVNAFPAGIFEIEGEVASFGVSQGKWVHFDLKDDSAVVNCFLNIQQLREHIEDGMKIAVAGYPNVYPRYGKFSFIVRAIRLSGEGSLKRAYELLMKKLETEGLFALERKRQLPKFPERVALITSREAAAFTDFIRVAGNRWPLAEIVLFPVTVQGEAAVKEIIAAFHKIAEIPDAFDSIALVRGGGSLEDLHVFNTEGVARAIFASPTPTITGVGHERDITIADFVADKRAATPSNAAELLFPNALDISRQVRFFAERCEYVIDGRIGRERGKLQHLIFAADHWVADLNKHCRELEELLSRAMANSGERIRADRERVLHSVRIMHSLHPTAILKRGYSYTKAADGSIIDSVKKVRGGQVVEQVYHDGEAEFLCMKNIQKQEN